MTAESGGGGDEKGRVVILFPWESCSHLGTIVPLSTCPLGALSMVQQPYLPAIRNQDISLLVLDSGL